MNNDDYEPRLNDGSEQPGDTGTEAAETNLQPQNDGKPADAAHETGLTEQKSGNTMPVMLAQSMPMPESRFTGGALANFFIGLIAFIVSVITLTLAYPAMKCWKMRWQTKHTYINGRHLVFDGKGIQLFGKYIIWFLLTIITLGIYYLVRGKLNIVRWQTKHTHIEGVENGESKFTGSAIGLFGHTLLVVFVTIITFTLGLYWGICHIRRWYVNHTVYDGYSLKFDGKGIQLFGKCICWALLTIITLGIYSFWLIVKVKKWITKHTDFIQGVVLPPVTDPKYMAAAAPVAMRAPVPAQQTAIRPQVAQQQYAQPYQPVYPVQPAPQSNGMATAGFVISLLSFIMFSFTLIMPILGIIFSSVGISKAKRTNTGKGLAITGLVLGILSLLWFLVFVGVILPLIAQLIQSL